MISNASTILHNEEKKEEVLNYAMVVFLKHYNKVSEFSVSLDNFKLIVHLYFISICNVFGIADSSMLRIGDGLYY